MLSRLIPISYTRGILGWVAVAHPQFSHLLAPFEQICLLDFVARVFIDPFKSYNFTLMLSRLIPIPYTRDVLGWAVVGCPSNVYHHLWCLSAHLHQICLLNFVPKVFIDPFKS